MDVFQSAAPVDYFEYFSKQFPDIVLNMTKLRDELAVRQGAINVVEDTVKARDEARALLRDTEQQTKSIKDEISKKLADAKQKSADAAALKQSYETQIADFNRYKEEQLANLKAREQLYDSRDASLNEREMTLNDRALALTQAQNELDRRVKEFQTRVASIAGLAG